LMAGSLVQSFGATGQCRLPAAVGGYAA